MRCVMAQTRGANGPGGRASARRRAGRLMIAGAVVAVLAGPIAGSAMAPAPSPTHLRLAAGIESLRVRWGVNGRAAGLRGFRVRWRALSGDPRSWSKPVERPASARSFTINALAPEPYKVRVRAVLADGAL